MATWDVARGPMRCSLCHGEVGAGEAVRLSEKTPNYRYCEKCSIGIDGETMPPDLPIITVADRLRTLAMAAGNAQAVNALASFDKTIIADIVRKNIQEQRRGVDPRGQDANRNGVVDQMRDSINNESDFQLRAEKGKKAKRHNPMRFHYDGR